MMLWDISFYLCVAGGIVLLLGLAIARRRPFFGQWFNKLGEERLKQIILVGCGLLFFGVIGLIVAWNVYPEVAANLG